MYNDQPNEHKTLIITLSTSPHKICILLLIATYSSGIFANEVALLKCFRRLIINVDERLFLPDLDDLLDLITEISGNNDLEMVLVHAIWSFTGLDSFETFMTKIGAMLVADYEEEKKLRQTRTSESLPKHLFTVDSVLGTFISRMKSEYTSLEFHECIQIWNCFSAYRDQSRRSKPTLRYKTTNQFFKEFFDIKNETILDAFSIEENSNFLMALSHGSVLQLHELTEPVMVPSDELSLVLSNVASAWNLEDKHMPQKLADIIGMMSTSDKALFPMVHYLDFLKFKSEASYDSAFDSLHRYFDYMMSKNENEFYHYALVSLADLHSRFGCNEEALRAAEEAISVARENKNTGSLKYLLTWLFDHVKDDMGVSTKIFDKAAAGSFLNYMKQEFRENRTDFPSATEDGLYVSTCLYSIDKMMKHGGSLVQLMATYMKAEFLTFFQHGKLDVAVSYSQMYSDMMLKCGFPSLANLYSANEDTDNIRAKVIKGMFQAHLQYELGNVAEAFKTIRYYEKTAYEDNSLYAYWLLRKKFLQIKQYVHRGNFHLAHELIDSIESSQSLNYLHAKCMIREGNCSKALKLVDCELAKDNIDVHSRIYFSSLKGEALAIGGGIYATRMVTRLKNNVKLAISTGIAYDVVLAVIAFAKICITLNMHKDALPYLDDTMHLALQLPSLELTSWYHVLYAQCKIKDAPQQEIISIFKNNLRTAETGFKRLQDIFSLKYTYQVSGETGIDELQKYSISRLSSLEHIEQRENMHGFL